MSESLSQPGVRIPLLIDHLLYKTCGNSNSKVFLQLRENMKISYPTIAYAIFAAETKYNIRVGDVPLLSNIMY